MVPRPHVEKSDVRRGIGLKDHVAASASTLTRASHSHSRAVRGGASPKRPVEALASDVRGPGMESGSLCVSVLLPPVLFSWPRDTSAS